MLVTAATTVPLLLLVTLLLLMAEDTASLSSSSSSSNNHAVVRRYLLVATAIDQPVVASCSELSPLYDVCDDDVDFWFPTARCYFAFEADTDTDSTTTIGDKKDGNNNEQQQQQLVMVRRTSFQCGKLGYQLWPAAVALSLNCCARARASQDTFHHQRILELGAGLGLPSVVCAQVLGAEAVLATDFWDENLPSYADSNTGTTNPAKVQGDNDKDNRLIPTAWHGVNLAYNLHQANGVPNSNARVQRLDWKDLEAVAKVRDEFQPDLVIGSDLVYYPSDLPLLYQTIECFLLENNNNNESGGGGREIVLLSPLPPIVREALPRFRAWLDDKARTGMFRVETQHYCMHEKSAAAAGSQDDESSSSSSFLRMSIMRSP